MVAGVAFVRSHLGSPPAEAEVGVVGAGAGVVEESGGLPRIWCAGAPDAPVPPAPHLLLLLLLLLHLLLLLLLLLLLHHLINEQAGTSHSPVQIQQINHTISSLPEYNWLSALRLAKQKHQKTRQIACCVHSTDKSSFGKSFSANQQN